MRGRKKNILPVSRHDNSNTTPGNIPKPDVEPTEFIADYEEHPEWLFGVLDLRQELWC